MKFKDIFEDYGQAHHYVGTILFLLGLAIMLWCIISFAIMGRGTLSPLDPTNRLVVSGPYHFSRNPMYVGVMLMLLGEAIYFQDVNLWIYALVVFIVFNIFIVLFEEPRLKYDFGEEYQLYCQKVKRWL